MLDIVFYKVLIALGDVVTCWSVCVSWRDARADVYRLGNYRNLCGGGSPGRLYKAVLYLAIPLSIFVTLLSMYGRPWAYTQIYQLEQQSQSELDVRQLRAKEI